MLVNKKSNSFCVHVSFLRRLFVVTCSTSLGSCANKHTFVLLTFEKNVNSLFNYTFKKLIKLCLYFYHSNLQQTFHRSWSCQIPPACHWLHSFDVSQSPLCFAEHHSSYRLHDGSISWSLVGLGEGCSAVCTKYNSINENISSKNLETSSRPSDGSSSGS